MISQEGTAVDEVQSRKHYHRLARRHRTRNVARTVTREVFKSCMSQPQPNADLKWIKSYILSDIIYENYLIISVIFKPLEKLFKY